MNNEEKFRSIIGETLNIAPEQINDGLNSDDVDTWDSLNHINLIGALEQEFGLMLDAQNITDTQSVAELRGLLASSGVEF